MEHNDEAKPLAFSYIRMSTASQLKGDSYRRQIEASRAYAKIANLQLVEELADIGISAFRGDNARSGRLSEFLKALGDGEIPKGSYLLVESLDRLSRQKITSALEQFLGILKHGINIVTLLDQQTYMAGNEDFSQLIISLTYMSRAFEESETKSKRLSEAWKAKREKIELKKLTSISPSWMHLSPDKTQYVLDEEKAAVVRLIFAKARDGDGSYTITRSLNMAGVRPFGRSSMWIKSYVTKILNNRAVIGEYQPHKLVAGRRIPEGDPIENYFPRVIADDLFFSVAASRTARKKLAGRRGPQDSNLFKNIAICYHCDSPMHYLNKGKGPKGGIYLQCSGANAGSGCSTKVWRYKDFEKSFLYFCRELDLRDLFLNAEIKNEKARIQARISTAEKNISALESQRDRIFAMLDRASASTNYILNKLEDISNRITSFQEEIEKLIVEKNSKTEDTHIDDEEFGVFIESLGKYDLSVNGASRSLLRSKLIEMVEYLRVAADGGKHARFWQKPWSEPRFNRDNEFGEFEKHEIMLVESKFDDPFFIAGLAGGTQRIVRVNSDDSTKYISYAEKNTSETNILYYDDNKI